MAHLRTPRHAFQRPRATGRAHGKRSAHPLPPKFAAPTRGPSSSAGAVSKRYSARVRSGGAEPHEALSSKGLRHIRWTPCLLDVALQRHAPGIPRVPNALWVRRSEPVFLRAAAAPAAPWHSAHCKPWPAAYNCLIDTGDSQKTPNFFARFLTFCLNKLLLFLFSSGSCPCQRALRSGKLKLR